MLLVLFSLWLSTNSLLAAVPTTLGAKLGDKEFTSWRRKEVTGHGRVTGALNYHRRAGLCLLTYYHLHLSLPSTTMTTNASSSSASSGQIQMPPPNADLETTWRFLEEGVDHIMTKLQTGVSYSKYMSLYTVSYNYCTSSRMHGAAEANGVTGRSEYSFL